MSDNIELPVNYERMGPPTITITPELARQIVALAGLHYYDDNGMAVAPDPTQTQLDTARMIGPGIVDARHAAEPFLGSAHQDMLEKAHAGDDVRVEGFNAAYAAVMDGTCSQSQAYDLVTQCRADAAVIAALRARVAEVEAETLATESLYLSHSEESQSLRVKNEHAFIMQREAEKERDRALADIAAERERREKAERDLDDLRATINPLSDRLAAERHIREKREVELGQCKADLAAERGKHAESRALWRDTMVERTAERDAARAEVAARESQLQGVANARREDQERIVRLVEDVAALKARKVVLPEYDGVFPADAAGGGDKPWYYKESVISAIRSAGVEVES